MPEYSVYIRSPNLTKKQELTCFASLEFISRFNRPGKWKISGDGSCPFAIGDGIIVKRDGAVIFSGVMKQTRKEMNADSFINRRWTVSGEDDLGLLAGRYALTDPIHLTISASPYDTQTGPAETVILNYASRNCGPQAHAARQIPYLGIASSQGRGAVITGNARFYPLIDFLYNLALLGGGIGYRVSHVENTTQLLFECYQPVDRTAAVKFSTEFGNVQSFTYEHDYPQAYFVWILGQGQGTARALSSAQDTASISQYGRIETVKDKRNEPDASKLSDWASAELAKQAAHIGYSFEPANIGSVGFAYGIDYCLGDRVTIADEGIVLTDIVTEVHITLDVNGLETIRPVIGQLPNVPLKSVFDRLGDIEDRVDTLETAQ